MKNAIVFGATLGAVLGFGCLSEARAAETKKPEIVDGTHGYYAENYVEPTDPLVKAEIEKFRDRKLALMIRADSSSDRCRREGRQSRA